jgi:hypothetical protein
MSFWRSLFGGASPAAGAGAGEKTSAPESYNGFVIRAAPFKSGAAYQVAGIIEKEVAGERKEHRFIRADSAASFEEAVAFSLMKARQIVDLQGERMFDEGRS